MKDKLIDSLKDILEVDEINDNDNLEDYEMWDSLAKLALITTIEEIYNKSISEDTIDTFKKINDIYLFLEV